MQSFPPLPTLTRRFKDRLRDAEDLIVLGLVACAFCACSFLFSVCALGAVLLLRREGGQRDESASTKQHNVSALGATGAAKRVGGEVVSIPDTLFRTPVRRPLSQGSELPVLARGKGPPPSAAFSAGANTPTKEFGVGNAFGFKGPAPGISASLDTREESSCCAIRC